MAWCKNSGPRKKSLMTTTGQEKAKRFLKHPTPLLSNSSVNYPIVSGSESPLSDEVPEFTTNIMSSGCHGRICLTLQDVETQ